MGGVPPSLSVSPSSLLSVLFCQRRLQEGVSESEQEP